MLHPFIGNPTYVASTDFVRLEVATHQLDVAPGVAAHLDAVTNGQILSCVNKINYASLVA